VNELEFKQRTKSLALRTMRLIDALPKTKAADVVGRQLLRSITSVGANYRSACRAKSKADMIAKLSLVEEEADESIYWIELLVESGCISAARVRAIVSETDEILSMSVASIKTLRNRREP
jgi:four helix bundle protein